MNTNWSYIPFSQIVEWQEKSKIKSGDGKTVGKYKMFICSDTAVKKYDESLVDKEALIFGTGGKASLHYCNEKFAYSTDCVVACKKDNHDCNNLKFYYYYLRQNRMQLLQKDFTGSGLQHTSKKKIGALTVPLPDIDEQNKIVAKIEELFSELDKAVDTLQNIKKQLAVYRQAVLKEAFTECINDVKMNDVAKMIDPQPSHRTPPEYENGVPYIGIGDIDYTKNTIKISEARKVSPTVYKEHLQRYKLHDGDFVMGKIGTIGKPFRLPLPQNYTLSANVILIQPNHEMINPEYLFWQFSSPLITEQLMKGKNETSQPAFGIQKARVLCIKMCSFENQNAIVKDIREKLSVCDNIEKTIDTALLQSEALRQTILKQAFEGELTK